MNWTVTLIAGFAALGGSATCYVASVAGQEGIGNQPLILLRDSHKPVTRLKSPFEELGLGGIETIPPTVQPDGNNSSAREGDDGSGEWSDRRPVLLAVGATPPCSGRWQCSQSSVALCWSA